MVRRRTVAAYPRFWSVMVLMCRLSTAKPPHAARYKLDSGMSYAFPGQPSAFWRFDRVVALVLFINDAQYPSATYRSGLGGTDG